jgi:hypothetical protein
MNNELEGTCKETPMLQSRYCTAAILEVEIKTIGPFIQGGHCPDKDSIRVPPEYKSGAFMQE